jgi:hypothetical protein
MVVTNPDLLVKKPCIWFGKGFGKSIMSSLLKSCIQDAKKLCIAEGGRVHSPANTAVIVLTKQLPYKCPIISERLNKFVMIPFVGHIKNIMFSESPEFKDDFNASPKFKDDFNALLAKYYSTDLNQLHWPESIKTIVNSQWITIYQDFINENSKEYIKGLKPVQLYQLFKNWLADHIQNVRIPTMDTALSELYQALK